MLNFFSNRTRPNSYILMLNRSLLNSFHVVLTESFMSWKLAAQLVACRSTFSHDEKRRNNTTSTCRRHTHEIRQLQFNMSSISVWDYKTRMRIQNRWKFSPLLGDIKRHFFDMHRFVLESTRNDYKWATKGKSRKWHGTDIIKPYSFKVRLMN